MKEKIILFFIGFFAFSSFCSYLTIQILHLPICFVELFYIPLLFSLRKYISVPQHCYFIFVFIIVSLSLLGMFQPVYDLNDILPTTRCFFWGGLVFLISRNNNVLSWDKLYYLTTGVVLGDLSNGCLNMIGMVFSIGEDREYAIDMNIVLGVLCIILMVLYKKSWFYSVLAGLLVPIIGFLSVSRGIFMFYLGAYLVSLLLKIRCNKYYLIPSILVFFIIGYISYNVYNSYEEEVRSYSPSIHNRLYKKVNNAGDNQADEGRLTAYYYMLNNFDHYFIPRGFIGKKFIIPKQDSDKEYMYPWDSSYSELLYTLGIFFIPIFLCFLKNLFLLLNNNNLNFMDNYIYASAFLVIIVELFFGYGLLKSPFTVASLGFVMGSGFNQVEKD